MTRFAITVYAVVWSLGCGDVQNSDAPSVADAPPSRDAPSLGPWGVVSKVDELSTGDARGPSMTADRLELYFAGGRAGGLGNYDIYKSTRATAQAAWSTPVLVMELSTSAADADPFVSPDGLTMWFDTDRDSVLSWDIWVSVRASRNDPWGGPTPVKELNTVKGDASPSVTADGLAIAFHSDRAGTDSDIYLSTRTTVGDTWRTPVPIAAVNSTAVDYDPALSPDGLQLYVTSSRPDGLGSRDLWLARRASRSSDFGPAADITELNTEGLDEAPWVSDDDRLIIFSRRPNNGAFGIYEATR